MTAEGDSQLHQFEDVPLVEFMCLVFTCMPGGVTKGDSALCCVCCPLSTIISLCLLILHQMFTLQTQTLQNKHKLEEVCDSKIYYGAAFRKLIRSTSNTSKHQRKIAWVQNFPHVKLGWTKWMWHLSCSLYLCSVIALTITNQQCFVKRFAQRFVGQAWYF